MNTFDVIQALGDELRRAFPLHRSTYMKAASSNSMRPGSLLHQNTRPLVEAMDLPRVGIQ
jgi:hypothetical protein